MSRLTKILSTVAVLAVLAAFVLVLWPDSEKKYLTASFPRTVSLYEGSDVRVLGVPIGTVDSVSPSGSDVTVKMSYDAKYKIPADAEAVIVSPAIVGDRFVQLTPVYKQGPVLSDGATLSTERTAMALELDEIYESIDQLTRALGPDGANKDGSLTQLLDSTAENFAGQGEQFHQTIEDLGKLTGTLDNNKEELFGTIQQMERFVSALAENDQTVRDFNQSFAAAAGVLEGEREELAKALKNLGVAMREVTGFVRENRDALSENITGLKNVTQILVRQRDAVAEILNVAPLALNNLFLTGNRSEGTLDTRTNLGENLAQLEENPGMVLCGLLLSGENTKDLGDTCKLLEAGGLPVGGAGAQAPSVPGLSRPAALSGNAKPAKPIEVEHVDTSLAGVVEVQS